MKKYLKYIEIAPIAVLTTIFVLFKENGHDNLIKKCKTQFIKIILSILVIGFLFFMLVHTKINKFLLTIIPNCGSICT